MCYRVAVKIQMSVREVRTEIVLICLLSIACIQCKPNESKEGHFFPYSILVPICTWSVLIFLCTTMYVEDDDASTLYIIAVVTSLV